ncbi:MAG: hypothetical protein WAL52_12920 [Candidatus Sulfotelmatobacter sp.]
MRHKILLIPNYVNDQYPTKRRRILQRKSPALRFLRSSFVNPSVVSWFIAFSDSMDK